MFQAGDIISYLEMCREECASLQRGMYFRLRGSKSIFLMSRRRDAPYEDEVLENGQVLLYEGHDVPRGSGGPDPKSVDQSGSTPVGSPTQNGLFYEAAHAYKRGAAPAEMVSVYEKILRGVWAYNGLFQLTDAWQERRGSRKVFRFRLELTSHPGVSKVVEPNREGQVRLIPTPVKLEVWKRDKGRCVQCGATNNLHFDHVIPFSKGGSSLVAENIQLLCARHNLEKRDKLE